MNSLNCQQDNAVIHPYVTIFATSVEINRETPADRPEKFIELEVVNTNWVVYSYPCPPAITSSLILRCLANYGIKL
uniref:Uncharacterized protein n=1 Tax=Heterorhabditis bacteriophora TaxID=37862 RepID=A0A1I7WFL9_HETBA